MDSERKTQIKSKLFYRKTAMMDHGREYANVVNRYNTFVGRMIIFLDEIDLLPSTCGPVYSDYLSTKKLEFVS